MRRENIPTTIFYNLLTLKNQNKTLPLHLPYRGMEQSVARRAHNPKVTGSSPVPATTRESL